MFQDIGFAVEMLADVFDCIMQLMRMRGARYPLQIIQAFRLAKHGRNFQHIRKLSSNASQDTRCQNP